MADDMGERTEKPTIKRLSDARRRGQVAKSQELTAAVGLAAGVIVLVVLGGPLASDLHAMMRSALSGEAAHNQFDASELPRTMKAMLIRGGLVLLPVVAIVLAATVLSQFSQVGPLFTTKPLKPNLSKINPISGLKKIFGLRNATKSGINALKLLLVLLIAWLVGRGHAEELAAVPRLGAAQGLYLVLGLLLELAAWLLVVLVVLAIIDIVYQRWQHQRDLRMTKHEVKDERRSMEGDPQVKKRRLQMSMQIAMQRIQSAVPRADVVVTNPTHFAVALRYDQESMRAPKVVAKGADLMALRVRQVAAAHAVPIVERPPLARALFFGVEVGREIPQDMYEAVAEVLAYVYRTEQAAAA
ncbi:MAG: flagellar biosynthesis protein FlhB [Phycisphaeraceae bacterium]|nr:flagellar biosynthesis protein FlhB [Phycisphaeraceae bacterium]MCW5754081.1 flagellar biosynthesis protein FlhB [Phycisphaeraceae bacterium]